MKRWSGALRLIGLGWYVGLSIAVGVAGGLWLDSKLDTSIVFTLVGLGIGLLVAFLGVYRMVLSVIEEEKDKEKS
ncbi:MAG: AtpZ/AtpI family protein [Dehalococcoidia bacterium]